MGNDKQSILLHENGKKHQENVERSLKTRRDTKDAQDKQAKQLKSSLAAMEQSALQSMTTGPDAHYFDTTSAGLGQPGAVGLPPYAGAGMGMYAQPIHSTVSATAHYHHHHHLLLLLRVKRHHQLISAKRIRRNGRHSKSKGKRKKRKRMQIPTTTTMMTCQRVNNLKRSGE